MENERRDRDSANGPGEEGTISNYKALILLALVLLFIVGLANKWWAPIIDEIARAI